MRSYTHANRGALLESMLDRTNTQYRNANIADVRKVPTPLQIIKDKGRTVEARKEKAQWVDFVGVYQGAAIAFDAKQVKAKSLPLTNITIDQYSFLKSWASQGAITFLVVMFTIPGQNEPQVYALPFNVLREFWEQKENGRKSIPLKVFDEAAIKIQTKDGFVLHYAAAIEALA